jgi:quinol-cytochrome oxidoreductase complex cytochrome b subunit
MMRPSFFSSLLANLRSLPAALRRGLRPGADPAAPPTQRMRRNFVYHLHVLKVSERTLHPLTTLGLGVVTATLFLVLVVTGVLLMIYYVPDPQKAYQSMQDIQYAVAFGGFVRALHRWAAHGMVFVILLHVMRVVFTGSYRRRELNWILGIGLGLCTLGLAFTGYLLPWDQLSFWAVSVSAAMLDNLPLVGGGIKSLLLGGEIVTSATLLRFYTLHVALLPAGLLLLLALHFWRIRKDGGLAASTSPGEDGADAGTLPAWPHLVLRESILVILVLVVLCLVSTFVAAPLGVPPDMYTPDNPEKAPWYFLWIQEAVSYSSVVGAFIFPGLLFFGFLLLPFLEREDPPGGAIVWLGARPCRRAAAISLAAGVAAFVAFEVFFSSGGDTADPLMRDLFNPATGMLLVAASAFVLGGWLTGSTRAAFLCGLVMMLVAMVGLTLMGMLRGPDWIFYFPWEAWPGGV